MELGGAQESSKVEEVEITPFYGRKKKEHVKLPEWLKTKIPVSAGYNRIKDDLRGLGLHTGEFCPISI